MPSMETPKKPSTAQLDDLDLSLKSCNLQLLRMLLSVGCQILLGPLCNRGCGLVSKVIMTLKGISGQGMLAPICLQQVHGIVSFQLPCYAQTAPVACLTKCVDDTHMHVHTHVNVLFLFALSILSQTQDYTYLNLEHDMSLLNTRMSQTQLKAIRDNQGRL